MQNNHPDSDEALLNIIGQWESSPLFKFFGKEANENKSALLTTFSEMQRVYLLFMAKNPKTDKKIDETGYHLFLIEQLLATA